MSDKHVKQFLIKKETDKMGSENTADHTGQSASDLRRGDCLRAVGHVLKTGDDNETVLIEVHDLTGQNTAHMQRILHYFRK